MASFQLPTSLAHLSQNTHNLSSAASFSTSQFFLNQKLDHIRTQNKSLICRAAKDSHDTNNSSSNKNTGDGKFDRRDILLGLGGLYGTTAVSHAAFAAPVDVTKCGDATTLPSGVTKIDCCPPPNPNIIDFKFPTGQPLRVRPAAHLVDDKYLAKYTKAMQIMRDLPKDDPHSFKQQAAIHCAYCDSSYQMVGFPNKKIDVHFSWLFFPFHRWYLYFYEKILGKLIDDPTFALPYWAWDTPNGMPIPAMYVNPNSPLYDTLRDANHQPPLKIDLNYSKSVASPTDEKELLKSNNSIMYNQMVSNSKTAELFFGKPYRAGDDQIKGQGSIENIPHTQVHIWTGDPNQPNGEDMGRFYSAGRDPIFYSHHANVDRMWNIWKTLPGKNRKEFKDTDWLDSAFLFYDENKQLVRVKVRDCVDTKKLGYVYQDIPLPWLNARPKRKAKKNKAMVANAAEAPVPIEDASTAFPKLLDKLVKIKVPRPNKSRSTQQKEDEEEILEIDGISFDGDEYIKFDVYINDEDEVESGPQNAEFAGAFSNVPSKVSKKVNTSLSLGITELLEDLGADDDDELVVALVPRTGKGKVTIGDIKIKISS